MTHANSQALLLLVVMTAATAITRFLPFWLFPASRKTPDTILYLGRMLPYAVSALLIVYCLKGVSPTVWPHGIPEAVSLLLIAALHFWKHNVLLSISGGSLCYVLLVQTVFA